MAQQLTTQNEMDAFAEQVARELGTHCRTRPGYPHKLGRIIIDDENRGLRLYQYDPRRPDRLQIYAGLPDETQVQAPSIKVTAISPAHVAREISRRLYPLHAQALEQVTQLTARQQAEERARRTVAEAIAAHLPGARVEEQHRRTRIIWQPTPAPTGQHAPAQVDSLSVTVGASGERVHVEAGGPPHAVLPMITALIRAPQE
ncbi:hypothetical protein ACIGAN_25675 [Streptomyces sp. NPDC085931]|uniref:hypothetical protein n=1 Tax=Streptomyces sp. NPDC085931 TaxID=3365740 RepID=UPI0037D74446